MILYRFKTFRTSYYFPYITKDMEFMYNLYTAYGGLLPRVYWWLFRHVYFIRWINRVDSNKVKFAYESINKIEGENSIMAFNLGTPGAEQKISILGIERKSGKKFFAKYSEKEKAKDLTRHEICVYHALKDSQLTPQIIDIKESDNYVWLKTSVIEGEPSSIKVLTKEIVDLSILISQKHLNHDTGRYHKLQTSLSHGDFCPWNMIKQEKEIKIIDWEMAAERPLGYDIFKFISQCSKLINSRVKNEEIISNNKKMINYYFTALGISDWEEYYDYYLSSIEK